MSNFGKPTSLCALQLMGSTVLLLREKEASGSMASFEVIKVGGDFQRFKLANPGDLVHLIKLPEMAVTKEGGE